MTEDIRATSPLEFHTPWKPSPNGRPKALTPPSDHSRDSADIQTHPASRRSLSPAPKHRAHNDTASEPATTTSSERNAPPAAAAHVERGATPGQRRPLSVISAMSCSMCSATGVNSLWRRDRAGKPICGKCCEQLRRRMNPRYVSSRLGFYCSAYAELLLPRPSLRAGKCLPRDHPRRPCRFADTHPRQTVDRLPTPLAALCRVTPSLHPTSTVTSQAPKRLPPTMGA